MNQNHQIRLEESHVAFKKIVSIVEKYDEDVQFALISQCRLSSDHEKVCIVDKSIFASYIDDNIFLVAKEQQLPFATKKELMQRMNETAFEYPSNLERTKTGSIKYQAKYEWCIQHPNLVAPVAYPELVTIQFSDLWQKGGKLLLEYLHRKFCDKIYKMAGDRKIQVPYGAIVTDYVGLSYDYPDDIVTEMLNCYGQNRCKTYTQPRKVYTSRIALLQFSFSMKNKRVDD